MKSEDLIMFEQDIKNNYEQAKIRAPVHLSGGNEQQLINIFGKIEKNDWVFSTHRSHYHALLKSGNPKWLREQIFLKRSSHINSKKYKIFTSAIVGGICPIALGVALDIKRRKGKNKVWCFVGDMAAHMGIFYECLKYATNFNLPITFIIEDNFFGVYTPTTKVWGERFDELWNENYYNKHVIYYEYKRIYPHYGVGKWINF